MTIILINLENNETFRAFFNSVDYYEGPLNWKGANFCIGSDEEYIEVQRRSYSTSEERIPDLLNSYCLISVKTALYRVKFVASLSINLSIPS